MSTYIKLYRKIKNTSVWCDSDKLKLWLYCLTEAMHSEQTFLYDNQKVDLLKGQFITGRHKIEEEFNRGVKKSSRVSGSTLFRWLELFQECEMLNIKKTPKYTIITVLNWGKYQCNEQQLNSSCTGVEQQLNSSCTQYKNEKNKKNDKNVNKTYISVIQNYTHNHEMIEALNSYVEMRKKQKGFTLRALELGLANLNKLAIDDDTKIEIINQSVLNAWKGFFPLNKLTTKKEEERIF